MMSLLTLTSLWYETNKFHVAACLFSDRLQKTSKCCKNTRHTRLTARVPRFCFLPNLEVHFPHSAFSTPRVFHIPHFPHPALHTPHSAFSTKPNLDVICDLLQNRRTATWNQFVNLIKINGQNRAFPLLWKISGFKHN